MIIKKINSLFHKHARVLSAIFAVIIIIAFMDFLTPGRGGCIGGGFGSDKVGTAFGKNVTLQDLLKLQNTLQVFASFSGQNLPNMEIPQLFAMYCSLLRAEQLGITAGTEEIAGLVRLFPAFQKDGKFDMALYQEMLNKGSVSEEEMREAARVYLTIQKLQGSIIGSVKVSDDEVETFYRATNPVLTVSVLSFSASDYLKQVPPPSDDVLKKFMEERPDMFVAPATFDALLVEASITDFQKEEEAKVTEADVAKFIAGNKELFGKDDLQEKTKKENIRKLLAIQAAGEKAQNIINDFAKKCYAELPGAKDRAQRLDLFRKLAAEAKLKVVPSGHVAFDSPAAQEIPFAPDFRTMPLDADTPVTRPQRSPKGYMLGYLLARTEAKPLTFEEAKEKVLAAYKENEARDRARKAAVAAADKIAKTESAKRSADLAKMGKCVSMTLSQEEMFKVMNDEKKAKMFELVAVHVMKLKAGDCTPAVDTDDGAMLVLVTQRKPADMSKFPTVKEQTRASLLRLKAMQAIADFERSIASQCTCFADRQAPAK